MEDTRTGLLEEEVGHLFTAGMRPDTKALLEGSVKARVHLFRRGAVSLCKQRAEARCILFIPWDMFL